MFACMSPELKANRVFMMDLIKELEPRKVELPCAPMPVTCSWFLSTGIKHVCGINRRRNDLVNLL